MSLVNPETWAMTRILRVEPVVNLFDKETRKRILAAAPSAVEMQPATYGAETGVFWSSSAFDTATIHFAVSLPSRFLLAVNHLDFGNNLRLTSEVTGLNDQYATFSRHAWGTTSHFGSGLSWLRYPVRDLDVQCGTFKTTDDHPWSDPKEVTTHTVLFSRKYEYPPRVVAWFHHIDTEQVKDLRVRVRAEDITRDGFILYVETWGDSILYTAAVSWLAHSVTRTDIATGTYSTESVRPRDSVALETVGNTSFEPAQFSAPPRVFMGLKSIHMAQEYNWRLDTLRATNVTRDGMTWHFDTWGDSVLYSAEAAFVAFEP